MEKAYFRIAKMDIGQRVLELWEHKSCGDDLPWVVTLDGVEIGQTRKCIFDYYFDEM